MCQKKSKKRKKQCKMLYSMGVIVHRVHRAVAGAKKKSAAPVGACTHMPASPAARMGAALLRARLRGDMESSTGCCCCCCCWECALGEAGAEREADSTLVRMPAGAPCISRSLKDSSRKRGDKEHKGDTERSLACTRRGEGGNDRGWVNSQKTRNRKDCKPLWAHRKQTSETGWQLLVGAAQCSCHPQCNCSRHGPLGTPVARQLEGPSLR